MFFAFWITVLSVRGVIFWLVYHGFVPAVFIRGYHIHHFVMGFLLLIAAVILLSKRIFSNYIPLTLIGSALALIFDEFLYWTRGHFTYWSLVNLAATVTIGVIIMSVHLLAKHNDAGQISKKRVALTTLLVISFSFCLFLLFHYDRLLNDVYTHKNPIRQEYSDPDDK